MYESYTQSRKWLLTINNPQDHGMTHDEIIDRAQKFNPDYVCLADEIGASGTLHTHVYLYSSSPMRFGTVKKRFPTAHIDKATGTSKEIRDYVCKQGKWADTDKAKTSVDGTFKEFGTLPSASQEKSPKMAQLMQDVKDGYSTTEIIENDPSFAFKINDIEALREKLLFEKFRKENRPVKTNYLFGDSGTGKTRSIYEKHPPEDVYRITDYSGQSGARFDDYHGEPVIVFEEFHSQVPISAMLNFLDIYPLRLPARYRDRVACFNTVYITSNIPLEQQYQEIQRKELETWHAFLRRIHLVMEFRRGIPQGRFPMRRFEKERLQRRSSLREHLPRLSSADHAPVKLIFVLLYLLVAILIWSKQDEIALTAETTALLSPIASFVMQHIFTVYLLVGGVFLSILILFPLGKRAVQDQLRSVGLVNHTDMVPALKRKYKDKQNPRISVWEFSSQGIPLKTWEDKQAAIETILDITIVKMKYGSGKSRVLLYTVPARTDLPEVIDWNDKYLSHKPFILELGESFTGSVTVDLVKVPHILLGGSTGSGKSVLLKLLLMQALKKGAIACIADFKGGVDFPPIWHKQCRMCIEEESTLALLTELVDELQRRKALLAASGQPNIDRYNKVAGEDLPRYIFACDEIAEVLDKTGLTKEQKEIVGKIESRLSMIARQGRAFGIHLILATQRPDANILSGQIKNNVNCRICGRADTILSQIILDSTAAAEQIPKDARGRFLLHDGTLFQAYWFDDRGG